MTLKFELPVTGDEREDALIRMRQVLFNFKLGVKSSKNMDGNEFRSVVLSMLPDSMTLDEIDFTLHCIIPTHKRVVK